VADLGRDAPYAERLLFEVPQGGTEDLAGSTCSGAVLQQMAGRLKDAVTGGEEATDGRTRADARRAGWSRNLAKGVRPRQRGCGSTVRGSSRRHLEGSRPWLCDADGRSRWAY
jgi:hypothetical protein